MKPIKKVTIHLPSDLLKRAQKATGKGITDTVREALKLIAARRAYEKLREYRGKYEPSIDLNELRED